MAESQDPKINRRERRARRKAAPELNVEWNDILIGRGYGNQFREYLTEHGISVIDLEESFCDILTLSPESDLDRVQKLIDDWQFGK